MLAELVRLRVEIGLISFELDPCKTMGEINANYQYSFFSVQKKHLILSFQAFMGLIEQISEPGVLFKVFQFFR